MLAVQQKRQKHGCVCVSTFFPLLHLKASDQLIRITWTNLLQLTSWQQVFHDSFFQMVTKHNEIPPPQKKSHALEIKFLECLRQTPRTLAKSRFCTTCRTQRQSGCQPECRRLAGSEECAPCWRKWWMRWREGGGACKPLVGWRSWRRTTYFYLQN